jgi:hypothetical protein
MERAGLSAKIPMLMPALGQTRTSVRAERGPFISQHRTLGTTCSPLLTRMRQHIRRKFALVGELDHADRGRVTRSGMTDHFARFHTMSSVRPAAVRGLVNFISSSVMDVMIRR